MSLSKHSELATEIPRLVSQPREHYLRQNEARIRSLALPQNSLDPLVKLHLHAITMADDLEAIHTSAARRHEADNNHRFSDIHERHRQAAVQFLLYHLDKLSIILL